MISKVKEHQINANNKYVGFNQLSNKIAKGEKKFNYDVNFFFAIETEKQKRRETNRRKNVNKYIR